MRRLSASVDAFVDEIISWLFCCDCVGWVDVEDVEREVEDRFQNRFFLGVLLPLLEESCCSCWRSACFCKV